MRVDGFLQLTARVLPIQRLQTQNQFRCPTDSAATMDFTSYWYTSRPVLDHAARSVTRRQSPLGTPLGIGCNSCTAAIDRKAAATGISI
ncbi:hypothetical protein PC122_g9261 [Phytophthora cactorum]|nr:hypothetical protein PC122_g9261 [Phytophthora cactorum]